jgi:hypothetical protein
MKFFNRKKKYAYDELFHKNKHYSIDELNKINQERWKKEDPAESEEKSIVLNELKALKDSNVDDDIVEQFMLSHGFEGKNTDDTGNEYWLCGHCSNIVKFKTREEYITHHFRVHG